MVYNQIYTSLCEQPEHSFLHMCKKDDGYAFDVSDSPTDATVFKEFIGEERLKRICKKPELELDPNSLVLTKSVVRKIFAGLLDIQKSDIDALQGTVEERFNQLIVLKDLKDIESFLLHSIENFKFDTANSSGKGFTGFVERVYISLHHHFKIVAETNQKTAELRDIEMLTSRLADREIQPGSVVHLHEGYFYVDRVFVSGGAYMALFKDLEGTRPPKLVFRGTAMRLSATEGLRSGLNDVQLEIGTLGIKSIWPELSKHLKQNDIQSIEILGKSLGGAHAQLLAVLVEGAAGITVEKLVTFCSVGAGQSANALFKKEILDKRTNPFKMQVVRNGGNSREMLDHVPSVGGVHLGEDTDSSKCDIEMYYISSGNEEVESSQGNSLALPLNFLVSFKDSHCRQTTIDTFNWKRIDSRAEIDQHLRMGNQLEKVRQLAAYAVHFFTFFKLNDSSFEAFYRNQKAQSPL